MNPVIEDDLPTPSKLASAYATERLILHLRQSPVTINEFADIAYRLIFYGCGLLTCKSPTLTGSGLREFIDLERQHISSYIAHIGRALGDGSVLLRCDLLPNDSEPFVKHRVGDMVAMTLGHIQSHLTQVSDERYEVMRLVHSAARRIGRYLTALLMTDQDVPRVFRVWRRHQDRMGEVYRFMEAQQEPRNTSQTSHDRLESIFSPIRESKAAPPPPGFENDLRGLAS